MPHRVDFDWFDIPRSTSPAQQRAADISRLLDPSYSSSSNSSSAAAYVDRHGDLHDPDYRHFPIAAPKHQHRPTTRPRWEMFDQDAVDDDDDDDELHEHNYQHKDRRRHSSFSSYQHHQQQRLRHHHYTPPHSFDSDDTVLDEYTYSNDSEFKSSSSGSGVSRIILRTKRELQKKRRSLDGYCSSSTTPSPIQVAPPPLPSPPDSHPSIVTPISTTQDSDVASLHAPSHHHPLTHTLSLQSTSPRSYRSRASLDFVGSRSRYYNRDEEDEEEEEPISPSDNKADAVWTPTCSQALKRQWQALSLSVRFSVFRAQKRLRSRLSMS